MVWIDGMPVDPFLAVGEAKRAGVWLHGNDPQPSGPRPEDPQNSELSEVDRPALERTAASCTDPQIIRELERAADQPAELAALVEDALAHDAWAFNFADRPRPRVRPPESEARARRAESIALTLPLPLEHYRGIYFADGYSSGGPTK
jgi:hypothetical protein